MSRRALLRAGLVGAGAAGFGASFWRSALAAGPATPGPGPYGVLRAADANGVQLPQGFRSRVVAIGGLPVVPTPYVFPIFPDGSATYATPDGGWILTVNSEVPSGGGGVSAIRFGRDGAVVDAYSILRGSSTNCSGGKTPWGTWMSGEEFDDGAIWECDPTGARPAVRLPAMGLFSHEAVAVDPEGQRLYLTEDDGAGNFYRFTPDRYPDCSSGVLEAALVAPDGSVTWGRVGNPLGGAADPTRRQVAGATVFRRGEGIWFDSGIVYVATTSDDKVHAYDTRAQRIEVVYDGAVLTDPPITDPDNICVAEHSGDLYCCEDSGSLDIGILTPDRIVAPFLRLDPNRHSGSETTGPSFSPDGRRLYFSSQRGLGLGVLFEISGPFRLERPAGLPPLGTAAPRTGGPAPGGPVGPALGVEVTRRASFATVRRRGLGVRLTLDAPASVEAVLRARLRRGGRVRTVVLGRVERRVPDAGPEALTVRLSRTGRALLRGRRTALRTAMTITIGSAPAVTREVVLYPLRSRRPSSPRR